MNWIKYLFKITLNNSFIFFIFSILLFYTSFISNVCTNAENNRSKLINYNDIKWIDTHFQEFGKLIIFYRFYFYTDYCHYSPNGNDIIADEITNALKTKFMIHL